MLFALITAYIAYRKAKENGRNPILWAIAGAGVFLLAQVLISLAIGILLGVGQAIWGWPDTIYDTYDMPVRILAIVASFGAAWGLFKLIERAPRAESGSRTPPPPPAFQ